MTRKRYVQSRFYYSDNACSKNERLGFMGFFGLKKQRVFDLSDRLGSKDKDDRKIKFERLPRKKTKSIWWLIFLFVVILYTFIFLKRFLFP